MRCLQLLNYLALQKKKTNNNIGKIVANKSKLSLWSIIYFEQHFNL